MPRLSFRLSFHRARRSQRRAAVAYRNVRLNIRSFHWPQSNNSSDSEHEDFAEPVSLYVDLRVPPDADLVPPHTTDADVLNFFGNTATHVMEVAPRVFQVWFESIEARRTALRELRRSLLNGQEAQLYRCATNLMTFRLYDFALNLTSNAIEGLVRQVFEPYGEIVRIHFRDPVNHLGFCYLYLRRDPHVDMGPILEEVNQTEFLTGQGRSLIRVGYETFFAEKCNMKRRVNTEVLEHD